MTELTPAECRACAEQFNVAPYYQLLGIRADSNAPGTSRVELAFDKKLTQLYGGVHGGVLLTIADSAICVAIFTTLADTEALGTVELSMHFLAPAGPNDLVATARVTRRGKRLAFGECTIAAGGREIARAQGIAAIGEKAKIDQRPG